VVQFSDNMYHRQRTAVALHCCKVHARMNRKIGNSSPWRCQDLLRGGAKLEIRSWGTLLTDRQTDRQTDKQTNKCRAKQYLLGLAEVIMKIWLSGSRGWTQQPRAGFIHA